MNPDTTHNTDEIIDNLSKHMSFLLTHANVGQINSKHIDSSDINETVRLLPLTDLANIQLGASVLNISHESERLLQMIQFLKFKQLHNNVTNKLNVCTLQSEQFLHTTGQNVTTIETVLNSLSIIVGDLQDFQNNSILQYMDSE